MDRFEYEIKKLTEKLSKRELAEMLLGYKETSHTYYKDNKSLREENESLRYLIAKYNIELE